MILDQGGLPAALAALNTPVEEELDPDVAGPPPVVLTGDVAGKIVYLVSALMRLDAGARSEFTTLGGVDVMEELIRQAEDPGVGDRKLVVKLVQMVADVVAFNVVEERVEDWEKGNVMHIAVNEEEAAPAAPEDH